MTHLELENLASDYLEGLLAPASRAAVEAHLTECAACRELVGDVRRALELCRSAEQVEPAPWLVAKILRATVGERKRAQALGWLTALVILASFVAMALSYFNVI
jgi:predicted anti-sigma-YlaC factor YlaD